MQALRLSRAAVIGTVIGAVGLALVTSITGAAAGDCAIERLQPKAPSGTKVTGAVLLPAANGLPAYCQVDGSVDTPGNTVSFRLGLPATWNSKFYFQGVGGFAGAIGSLNAGLARGYASASTDTGHKAAVATDASWALNDHPKRIDYGYRGTNVTAAAAKRLTEAYYGSAPLHSYFNGCSNGGRQALMEAQRFPEDFDGIIAGDPSFGTTGYLRRTLLYQSMLSSSDRYLTPAKIDLIAKTVLASCDARDGLTDGLIDDPRACSFRPEALKCSGGDGPNCLTAGQIETLRLIHSDISTPSGKLLRGSPVGHEDGTTGWQQWITGTGDVVTGADGKLRFGETSPLGYKFQDGYFRYLAFELHNPGFDWRVLNLDQHGAALEALAPIYSPTDPDLRRLQQRHGKLILYHGWADPAISAYGTISYYDNVVAALGGREQAEQSVRLFMAPGMHHCQGNGPGPNTFDVLTALENWVERGMAPTRIVASHSTKGVVDRTRPLCPYPQVARYTGSGSLDAAESFRCEASPTQSSSR